MIQFPKPDVKQFFQSYVIDLFALSANEERLIFSANINGHYNLWAIPLNGSNRYPYRLTYSNQACSFIKVDPQGRHILAGFDQDGDENYQIYALKPEGGELHKLIEAEDAEKLFFAQLSEDGKRVYYITSEANPQFLNTRCYDIESGQNELLIQGEDAVTFASAISPNEQLIAYVKHLANTFTPGYVRVNGEDLCVTPSPDVVHVVRGLTFIDDETVLFATDYESDFGYLAAYHIPTRKFEELYRIPQSNISDIKWHKESRTVILFTERGVEDQLYRWSLDTKELESISLPVSVIEDYKVADSGRIYVLGRSATKPTNIYREAEGAWEALTDNRVVGLTEEDLVEPEVVKYRSFDDIDIEALLFRAKDEVANGYTVFWPHGGPQAAERKSFRSLFQTLLANGYHIFAPNFRGSTGYGSNFTKLVECDWGEGPRKDCLKGMEWLFEQGISSRDKLFVIGGSYGGYMTLLLAGRHADYFKAAVDIFGVSNLFTFVTSVPDFWKPMMERWVGDPEKDRERFITDSPITYLDTMVNPMLVIQGANDPRVVKEESDQIVEALRSKGRDVEYVVLDNEGHGFSKKENEILVYERMLDFLKRHQYVE
ncbi:S9 family peptidase [Paenibacillus sp. 481]|uniref:S9 family peptidase n=1 Tax=Paenibacillus sp. 481 TaxID=2835869 RepID=UPI001E615FA0|nr:S9 family peptidase [Paenibacillus sp. 481]UHA75550.1 S9 family peptidase [Paenibacillus sp. 481]